MNNIRKRTEALEMKLSQEYVLPKHVVLEKGYTYLGSLLAAASEGYYTARSCRNMEQPVTDEEWKHIKHFAMFKSCYQDNCLTDNGKYVRPCLPVFHREKPDK